MKNVIKGNRFILSLLLVVSCATFSCSDDDEDENENMLQMNTATLSGAQEVPANTSQATGTLSGSYDKDANLLTYNLTFSGLTPAATAAHFHKGAVGQNGPVVVPIGSSPLTSPVSAQVTLTDEQEADVLAGLWYVNVHSPTFPGGEIRTQVILND